MWHPDSSVASPLRNFEHYLNIYTFKLLLRIRLVNAQRHWRDVLLTWRFGEPVSAVSFAFTAEHKMLTDRFFCDSSSTWLFATAATQQQHSSPIADIVDLHRNA